MPQKIAKNTFIKGMNLDADISYQPKGTYKECEEFRVVVDSNATMGSLSNVKGNTDLGLNFTLFQSIVGSIVLEDYIILFVHYSFDPTEYDEIYKVTFSGETASKTLLWSDEGKADEDKLNLTSTSVIKGVSRKEATDIEKVYWVDGDNNYLRYVNVAEYLTTDGLVYNVATNDYVSAKTFGTVADITFTEPVLSASGGGGLNAGVVQYAYQLYNKNGSESSFSPASGLYHLSSSSNTAADNRNYKGNAVEDESGKSFTFDITLETYAFDSIRVVSIFYDYYSQLPTINIINEKAIPDTGIITFTDRGTGYIGSYTIEQFTAIAGLYKAKDIASSKNYLFLANTTENYFDVGSYDARSYRFRTTAGTPVPGSDTTSSFGISSGVLGVTATYTDDDTIAVNILDILSAHSFPAGRTDIVITAVTITSALEGSYNIDPTGSDLIDNILGDLSDSGLSYNSGTGELDFNIDSSTSIFNGDSVLAITTFDVDITLDYTYNVTTPVVEAHNHEGDTNYHKILTDGSWTYRNASHVVLSSGTNWSIDSSRNLINWYNDPVNDGDATYEFNLKSDGTTLGGVGKNIDYYFSYLTFTADDDEYGYTLRTSAQDAVLGYFNYSSPNRTANYKGYQRDETYRFGIVFFDRYGRESIVNWIGDIRMPNISDYNIANNNTKNYITTVHPIFTVNNYPTGAVSYKIVRLERNTEDKSIVCSGIVRPTLRTQGDNNNRQTFHTTGSGDSLETISWVKYDLQEFISPEISFYKSLQVLGDDYIEIHDLSDIVDYDPKGHDSTANEDDVQLKCRTTVASSSAITLDIDDGKIIQPLLEGEDIPVGTLSFYGYFKGDDDFQEKNGIKGTSLIFNNIAETDIYNVVGDDEFTKEYIKYGIYRRDIQISQYGGNTYSSRALNEYIGTGESVTIPSNEASTTISVFNGDTFVGYHEQMVLSHAGDDMDNVFLNIMFPVESSINLQLRHDDRFSTIYNNTSHDYMLLREEGVADGDAQYTEMYLYNTVYSQENTLKKYFPLPEGEEFEETKEFNTRILVSEKKFNGEESDSWLSFLTNNFIDVDANHGELNNIMDYSNNLLFWQPRGFGIVDVDPRSLITDNNPGALILGTGAVLSRFDYLSTMTGNTDLFGLIKTSKGVYWYDNEQQMIIRYNGKSIERLSKLFGVQSHLNENPYTTSYIGFDNKYDEVLFSLRGSGFKTLVFNELTNSFTGFYGFNSVRYIQYKDRLITTDENVDLWLHDSATSAYGVYYGNSILASNIKIPINESIDIVKVFDNINFSSYSYTSSNILNYDDTFNTIRCYNSYQNTDYTTLTPGTNIERKKGLWSTHISRNAVNVDPSTNPDIFAAGNLVGATIPRPRIRDTYMLMDLTYNNTNDYRFTVPFVHTKYRMNFR